MNQIRVSLILASLAAIIPAAAKPVSQAEALARALGDKDAPAVMKAKAANARFSLALTRQDRGSDALYVFSSPADGAFIVTPADDLAPALLGYSDAPLAGPDGQIAPAFDYWLSFLSSQIAFLRQNPAAARTSRAGESDREPIEPLCTTKWNQGIPYNNYCPVKDGKRCYTGCSATAAAQVLKYHNWPDQGTGEHSYSWNDETLSFDFGNTVFDWNSMIDDYYYDYSEKQADAIATLMKALGYSLDMMYSPEGSGAYSMSVGYALAEYFKYDKSLRYLKREWTNADDWEDTIYNSLKLYGPVIYNGVSRDGGHSFVCDGYSSDHYFHINWGWGGVSNGYFLLDALDPDEQGAGGSGDNSGFNFSQDIICDIRPDRDGSSQYNPILSSFSDFDMSYDSESDVLTLKNMIYNPGPAPLKNFYLGFTFTPLTIFNTPADETIAFIDFEETELMPKYGFSELAMELGEFEPGRYLVDFVYGVSEEDLRSPIKPYGASNAFVLYVVNDKKRLYQQAPKYYEASDISIPEEFDLENPLHFSCTLTNSFESTKSTRLKLIFVDPKDAESENPEILGETSPIFANVAADSSVEWIQDMTFKKSEGLLPGNDYVAILTQIDLSNGLHRMSDGYRMRFTSSSGIDSLPAGLDSLTAEGAVVYNLQGIRIATVAPGAPLPDLPAATYLIQTPAKTIKLTLH